MDLWTFIGFAAVIGLLAAIEKQLIAIHKDIVETKVKVEYMNALVLKNDVPVQKVPGGIDARESRSAVVS